MVLYGGILMSRMKDWMMDMEETTVDALEAGAKTVNDVLAYVNTEMATVDNAYVKKVVNELMGPDDDI
jgi:hypothetical protein